MSNAPHKPKVKTNLERAEQLDRDAAEEHKRHNYVYANDLARSAHHLRMEHQQEAERDKLKKS